MKVLYAEGCKITLGKEGYSGWYENDVKLPAPGSETASVKAAADLAKKADVAIVVVGENETSNREAWSENHLGDRDSLDLLGAQEELVKVGGRDGRADGSVPDQWAAAFHQLCCRACTGDCGRLVSRPRGWNGSSENAVRRCESGWEAADYLSAVCGTVAGLLRSQAVAKPELCVRR